MLPFPLSVALAAGLTLAPNAQSTAPIQRDSAEVARLLASLRASDSTVCELAGRALTNFGGMWHREWDAPMPMPMPTPMPMPFAGGGVHAHPRGHGVRGRGQ